MPLNLFGFSVSRKNTQPEAPVAHIESFATPEQDDGAHLIEAGGLYGQTLDLDGVIKNDIDMIVKYRSMIHHHEVDAAVSDIVNESIITTEASRPVDFNRRGDEIFRKWYIDSRLYYHVILDNKNKKRGIQELRAIDPTKIRKVKEIIKDDIKTVDS